MQICSSTQHQASPYFPPTVATGVLRNYLLIITQVVELTEDLWGVMTDNNTLRVFNGCMFFSIRINSKCDLELKYVFFISGLI